MIFLRFFLYLICIVSIGWSIIIFGGPPFVKKLVALYSNGTVTLSNVSISPKLDISVGRLDFKVNQLGVPVNGFSRSTEITWSIFNEKPFLSFELGPTVIKNFMVADGIKINTNTFREFDWQDVYLILNSQNLQISSYGTAADFTLQGNYQRNSRRLLNLRFDGKNITANDEILPWSASSISALIDTLDLKLPLKEQFSGSFWANEIILNDLISRVLILNGTVYQNMKSKDIKLSLKNVQFEGFGARTEEINISGKYNHQGTLEDLLVNFINAEFSDGNGLLPELSVEIIKENANNYGALMKGHFREFMLNIEENFIGTIPATDFIIDLDLNTKQAKVETDTIISFSTADGSKISGTAGIKLVADQFDIRSLCIEKDCEFSNMEFEYQLSLANEWLRGRSYCQAVPCDFDGLSHFVETSNTVNIFTHLNEAKILNPLSSVYLYSVVSSGDKIDGGHQLKF